MTNQFYIFIAPFIIIPIIFYILYRFKDTYLVKHNKRKHKHITYYQSVTKKKWNVTGFRIGLKLAAGIHLVFTRKNNDKSDYSYINSNEFDDMISVSIESIAIDKQRIIDEVKDIILSIFYDTSCNCTIDKIHTFQDRIWLTIESHSYLSNKDIDFITNNILERFNLLNEKLKSIITHAIIPKSKDKVAHEKFSILSLSIMVYGIFSFPLVMIFDNYKHHTIDLLHLAFVTILFSILIFSILCGVYSVGIKNKFQLINNTIVPALIGLWLTFYFILSIANALFDKSHAISYTSIVHDKTIKCYTSKRSTECGYILAISTLHRDNYKLHVPYSFFAKISLNEKLLITEQTGLLNANWISSYKRL